MATEPGQQITVPFGQYLVVGDPGHPEEVYAFDRAVKITLYAKRPVRLSASAHVLAPVRQRFTIQVRPATPFKEI